MDLKLEVSAGASRKLNRQQYGGFPFESSDVWVSFKKELPADADQGLVEATARHLQKLADLELGAEVERVISSIQGREVAKTQEKRSSVAQDAPQTPSGCAHNPDKPCFPCRQAFKNGAVPAKPKEVIPDGPNGEPW